MINFGHKEKSLKHSLIKKLLLLGFILFASMMAILAYQYTIGMNQATEIASKLDARMMVHQFKEMPDESVLKLSSTFAYREWQFLPKLIRNAVGEKERLLKDPFIEGVYLRERTEYYFSILAYPTASEETLYLVNEYPYSELKTLLNEYLTMVMKYSFWTLLSFVILLFFLTILWMRQLGLPFTQMQRWAKKLGKDNALPRESYQFKEFNQLAEQLENSMKRVMAFNDREKQFLRHASHELRTPLAIIQATLDTLQEQYVDDKRLLRIRYAINNMQTISTSLLWLARESKEPLDSAKINLRDKCEAIVIELDYLNQNKSISVSVSGDASIVQHAPLVHITLENLIRNAYQHSADGIIDIQINEQGLVISNPHENDSNTHGFGLGLDLVERICQKQKWSLKVIQKTLQFQASLSFNETSARNL